MPKWAWWLIGFLTLWWIIANPVGAASFVHHVGAGIVTFLTSLVHLR